MELTELHQAYLEEYGEPDYKFSMLAEDRQLMPHKLDIVCRFPDEEEAINVSYLMTLGLATYSMDLPCERAELVIEIRGKCSVEDCDNLGKALANLIWNRIKSGLNFFPDLIIRNTNIPVFNSMKCLFIADWGYSYPEWLEETESDVRLLKVVPIYQSEANILESLSESTKITVFVEAQGEWNNPKRQPNLLLKQATNGVWEKIEKWYLKEAPLVFKELNKGASKEDINDLEEKLKLILPEDFAASLSRHNGGGGFHAYDYLTINQIYEFWSMMNRLKEENAFSAYSIAEHNLGIIQNTWWDSHWIPFALDSGGNAICIDLNPEKSGIYGQIIYKEKNEGPLVSQYQSFFEWIWFYKQDLYRGVYFVDRHGFIQEKC